jgi:GNAT superfamily N-acetyltransferase
LAAMRIEQFDPAAEPAKRETCRELYELAREVDDPALPPMPPGLFTNWWQYGFTAAPRQIWLACEESGQPAGCYLLELPDRDNTTAGWCTVVVAPRLRRRGIGTALLAHCAGQARQAGRDHLVSDAPVGSAGAAFAVAAGATPDLPGVRRQLDIGPELPARLAALRAQAAPLAAGYRLEGWTGATEAGLAEQVAGMGLAMNDAPRGDSEEPMQWDAERVRRSEQDSLAAGLRLYSVGALTADGELAGYTQTQVDPAQPDWASQAITVVPARHRGHRLGLLVKIGMLKLLARHEPAVRHLLTYNAESNTHMVAINDRLGYVFNARVLPFELKLS